MSEDTCMIDYHMECDQDLGKSSAICQCGPAKVERATSCTEIEDQADCSSPQCVWNQNTCKASYVMGSAGSNTCPSGSERVAAADASPQNAAASTLAAAMNECSN